MKESKKQRKREKQLVLAVSLDREVGVIVLEGV